MGEISKEIVYGPRPETFLLTCAPKEVQNQSAHSRSLIRVFVVRMTKFCIISYSKCAVKILVTNAQVDLNLHWEHMSKGTPASILRKSTSGRHRPVSYPDGPMTARYRFT